MSDGSILLALYALVVVFVLLGADSDE